MKLAPWLSLIRFGHSIFALPFALIAAWLAAGGPPRLGILGLIVLCAVSARTAAMAFNRWLDRDLDAANPRTRGRELPSGVLRPGPVLALVVVASLVFVAGSFALNPLCGRLSPLVLAVLLSYSATKRFTWLAHGVLGLSLALAPLGAWLAVTGSFEGDLFVPLVLAAAVLLWVAGFDLIYASQDTEHDRAARLHSIPARFGVRRALRVSALLHVGTVVGLLAVARHAHLSWIFYTVVGVAAVLLGIQHRIVRPDDLSRVDVAFFTLNGWVSVALFLGTVLDLALHTAGGAL